MKRFYFLSLFSTILLSCSKSNKQQLSVTEQNLTSTEWKWRYTDTVTLQANEIINSVYTRNNGCVASISFHTNKTYDEKNPCYNPTLSDDHENWELLNDSTLLLGYPPLIPIPAGYTLYIKPTKITKLTKDTLQIVTRTLYFEKGGSGVEYIDSIQTRETYSH
ncbi:MAG: hypothetical protein JST96_13240 [Bacteroidetes bacterium]|nr:hypothetical protein [Bacteroidota bacterium]